MEPTAFTTLYNDGAFGTPILKIRLVILFAAGLAASACGNDSQTADSSQSAFTSQSVLTPIPEPFRNVWAEEAADCASPDGPTRVSVDPATVSFHEGRFDVVSLNESDEAQLLLSVRFQGGPVQTHILKVSDQAETLSYTGPGIMRTLRRCHP